MDLANIISKRLLFILSAVFIALAAIGIYFEQMVVLLIPAVLVVMWSAIYKLDYLIMFIVFCTPLSINLENMDGANVGMYLPTEPLLFGVLILFIFKVISGKSIDPAIFKHPVSYYIYAYLTWMTVTCISSEEPIISFKLLLTRLWFIVPLYFITAHIFSDIKKMKTYVYLYMFTLAVVIIYAVTRHAEFKFSKDAAHWVMEPLFKDHTIYGAVLAMYFPMVVALMMQRKTPGAIRIFLTVVFLILTVGLILSFTRAAWVSVFAAALMLIPLLMRVPLQFIVICLFVGGFVAASNWEDLKIQLEGNKQESSSNLDEHVKSISNVSSDASNLERVNRWNCAIELFKKRPVFGWGPGIYQFVYAPFQRAKDKTIISTNQGDGGNAHSEYLGPLAEQGVLGLVMVVALIYGISQLAFRLFYTLTDRDLKILVAGAYLGLITYFVHGVLNNFLDSDKASVPFWGFTAMLVAIDLYHKKSSTEQSA
jgi:putative inorganic carbon (HCO3(-)) transporter